jgi:hypothetical protein
VLYAPSSRGIISGAGATFCGSIDASGSALLVGTALSSGRVSERATVVSVECVRGVGVYESEFKLKTNSATVFEQNKIIKKAIPEATLNLKNNEEKEWPPKLE